MWVFWDMMRCLSKVEGSPGRGILDLTGFRSNPIICNLGILIGDEPQFSQDLGTDLRLWISESRSLRLSDGTTLEN